MIGFKLCFQITTMLHRIPKRKFLLISGALAILTGCLFSSPKNDPFEGFRSFGGSEWETATSIKKTIDQGYIVSIQIGDYFPHSMKTWIVKLDAKRNTQWTFLDSTGRDTYVWDVIQTSGLGYLYTGCERTQGGDTTFIPYVKHLDAAGKLLWKKYYGQQFKDGAVTHIEEASDGNFVVSVIDYRNPFMSWVQKLDSNGNPLWHKTLSTFSISKFIETRDGGLLFVGQKGRDGYALKTDENGDSLWGVTLPRQEKMALYDIQETQGNQYVTVGGTRFSLELVKVDSAGTVLWTRKHPGQYALNPFCLRETPDKGFILVGSALSKNPSNFEDGYIIKTDSNGILIHSSFYGWENTDQLFAMANSDPGRFMVVGRTEFFGSGNFNMWLFEVDAEGKLVR